MGKGFVFGKFLPFHKGHEALIRFALTQCSSLKVLVCCSDHESISGEIRQRWIENTFSTDDSLEVDCFHYLESELPNTSEASMDISRLWSEQFKLLVPDCEVVITSEEYGEYVAEFMGIRHLPFDIPRETIPISATKICNDLSVGWQFLPDSVKPFFSTKVVILGTESTGKSTLALALQKKYGSSLVTEAGRDLIPDSKSFTHDTLYEVAQEHAKRIDAAVLGVSPLVIIDTDIHITKSYSEFIFDVQLDVDEEIYGSNKADLYLYLNNDVAHVHDGTRLSEEDRNLLDVSHRKILNQHQIPYVEISGTWEDRFDLANKKIDYLLNVKNAIYRGYKTP